MNNDTIYTCDQVQKMFAVPFMAVYEWGQLGRLKSCGFNRDNYNRKLYSQSDILAFIKQAYVTNSFGIFSINAHLALDYMKVSPEIFGELIAKTPRQIYSARSRARNASKPKVKVEKKVQAQVPLIQSKFKTTHRKGYIEQLVQFSKEKA